jgi:spore germination cell wall hydrolase CwlJ-like protein
MSAQVAKILDLGLDPRYAFLLPREERRTGNSRTMWVAVAALVGLALFGAFRLTQLAFNADNSRAATDQIAERKLAEVVAMTVDDTSQIIARGLTAEEKNAAIPVSSLPIERAGGFSLAATEASSYATALHCLSQAVYYEAAAEPMQGRRAVAQVILNRMLHPAFPKSVCGVIYQGSQRRTGCQFSFTCDGALMRAPASGLWREAQGVARAALAGYVEASVGTATHYHADYVLPKWAFSLGKVNQFGRHIFYRLQGNWGSRLAFTGRYNGMEAIPQINLAALRLRASEGDMLPVMEGACTPGLTVTPLVSDRHAPTDVGGRLDVTKEWRLSIPDPVNASSRYRDRIGADSPDNTAAQSGTGAEPLLAAASAEPKT